MPVYETHIIGVGSVVAMRPDLVPGQNQFVVTGIAPDLGSFAGNGIVSRDPLAISPLSGTFEPSGIFQVPDQTYTIDTILGGLENSGRSYNARETLEAMRESLNRSFTVQVIHFPEE
jgi:hypothetical protein